MTAPNRRLGVFIIAALALLLWSALVVGFDRGFRATVSDDPEDGGANKAAEAMGWFLWGIWGVGALLIVVPAVVIARDGRAR